MRGQFENGCPRGKEVLEPPKVVREV